MPFFGILLKLFKVKFKYKILLKLYNVFEMLYILKKKCVFQISVLQVFPFYLKKKIISGSISHTYIWNIPDVWFLVFTLFFYENAQNIWKQILYRTRILKFGMHSSYFFSQ